MKPEINYHTHSGLRLWSRSFERMTRRPKVY
jgi:hypothetical protein